MNTPCSQAIRAEALSVCTSCIGGGLQQPFLAAQLTASVKVSPPNDVGRQNHQHERGRALTYLEGPHLIQGLQSRTPAQRAALPQRLQHSVEGEQVRLHPLLSHLSQQALRTEEAEGPGEQGSKHIPHEKGVGVSADAPFPPLI